MTALDEGERSRAAAKNGQLKRRKVRESDNKQTESVRQKCAERNRGKAGGEEAEAGR